MCTRHVLWIGASFGKKIEKSLQPFGSIFWFIPMHPFDSIFCKSTSGKLFPIAMFALHIYFLAFWKKTDCFHAIAATIRSVLFHLFPSHLFSLSFCSASKASCRSAIDAARSVVEDLGVSSTARSGGLTELAGCKEQNSERDCRRLLVTKYRLSLPVERSVLGTSNIPILTMTSWLNFMLRNNCWHVLCGLVNPNKVREADILKNFWQKYRKVCPQHDVFKMAAAGDLKLERTAPILLHGDEGRGRKHTAYLVVSFRGLLGRGIQPGQREKRSKKVRKPYLKQLCNYKGHSYTSRYMIAGLRKCDYTGGNSDVFPALMSSCSEQAQSVATTGALDLEGQRCWLMLLGITGDWPWLHKSGGFKRSFHNAQKRKNQVVANGICHECRAGQNNIAFEQIGTQRPCWVQTLYEEDPFTELSPFRHVPHNRGKLPSMWMWDFFHTWHLGIAKRFIGSTLALLSMVEQGGSVDERFALLSNRYLSWCSRTKHRSHVQSISKETIAWQTTGIFPCGIWHKGELSTVLMLFLEATFIERDFPDEPLLGLVKEATNAINSAIRIMYKSDLWLTVDQCYEVAGHGLRFLRRYEELARQSMDRGMNLFEFAPKIHPLQKIFLRLHWGATSNIEQLNPLSVSVQQCEDFISRPSRLSRRVAGGSIAPQRVMDRYLMACYSQWIAAKYIVRP